MSIQKFPRPVVSKVRVQTDEQVAKIGQLNQLVRDINHLNISGTAYTDIPFIAYPPASLVNEGSKFTYTDGVELISYHIKGIFNYFDTTDYISQYLCTVRLISAMIPVFPGSLTGMVQYFDNSDIITSPLAVGAPILGNPNNVNSSMNTCGINLYPYMDNPQPDGLNYYAVIFEAVLSDTYSINLTISYDFELLYPNFLPAPTIFQD